MILAGTPPAVPHLDLREVRRARHLRTVDVAALVGVHPTTVLRWERGDRLPGPRHLRALAQCYELSVERVAACFDRRREQRGGGAQDWVGRGVRRLRLHAGLSARQLAERLLVSTTRVYNWEAGRTRVTADEAARLDAALGLAPGDSARLLERWSTPPPPPVVSELRRRRLRAGLSQVQLAGAAGVGLSSLKAWEAGRPPDLAGVRRVAGALGCSTSSLALALGVDLPRQLDLRSWRAGHLAEVLRVLRAWSGVTQSELAARLSCSTATVRAWENRCVVPGRSHREGLEVLYRLPPGALLLAYPVDAGT